MTEQELAISCARGDRKAQRELYEQYGSRILALCRRYAADPADAEDLMQDSFIKIFRVIGRFQWTRPGSLYSWMARIAINLAFDSAKRRRSLARQLVDVNDLKEDIPEETVYDETASVPLDVLWEMIGALPEGYRTVFTLYTIDGLSHREIADLLRIKEKSSSASLSRARSMLSTAVRQYWMDQEDGSSPDGWSQILRKMRRASALRGLMLTIALLIPAVSLMLWHDYSHRTDVHSSDIPLIAWNPESEILIDIFPAPAVILKNSPVQSSGSTPVRNEGYIHRETFVIQEDTISASSTERRDTYKHAAKDTAYYPSDHIWSSSPKQSDRYGRRFTFSLKAGSGTYRRNSKVSLASTPYIAALTFMNSVSPGMLPDVKANSSNAIPWYLQNYVSMPPAYDNQFTSNSANSYHHGLPVTFGLSARMNMNNRMGMESGIEYTWLHSNVDTSVGRLEQNLHFIGIPLRLDTRICSWNGLDMYLGAGIKAEKCINASLGKVSCEERRLQWSADAFAGAQYRISNRSHLYFQPELSYYFTKTDLITYRTENPLTFSLNIGLRFDL
ncbi:MAG: sigma-70 family RNA polymerase sigma factor [Bacteroidales bacterium]|nr:sigma-70 family RNA polymerase sigma factor [Bacteroidales bacterium]